MMSYDDEFSGDETSKIVLGVTTPLKPPSPAALPQFIINLPAKLDVGAGAVDYQKPIF